MVANTTGCLTNIRCLFLASSRSLILFMTKDLIQPNQKKHARWIERRGLGRLPFSVMSNWEWRPPTWIWFCYPTVFVPNTWLLQQIPVWTSWETRGLCNTGVITPLHPRTLCVPHLSLEILPLMQLNSDKMVTAMKYAHSAKMACLVSYHSDQPSFCPMW